MKIHRMIGWFGLAMLFASRVWAGETVQVRIGVDAGESVRTATPMIATLQIGTDISADDAKKLGAIVSAAISRPGSGDPPLPIVGQAEVNEKQVVVRWIEPSMPAKSTKDYNVILSPQHEA